MSKICSSNVCFWLCPLVVNGNSGVFIKYENHALNISLGPDEDKWIVTASNYLWTVIIYILVL